MGKKNRPAAPAAPAADPSMIRDFRDLAAAVSDEPPRERKDGGGAWPAEPFKRIGAWLKHNHEPQPAELLMLAHDLYRPLPTILSEIEKMSKQLDALTAQVAASNSVAESAITLLGGLKSQLDTAIAAEDDGQALQDLSDSLGSEKDKLAAAVVANTPAAAPAPSDPGAASGTGAAASGTVTG